MPVFIAKSMLTRKSHTRRVTVSNRPKQNDDGMRACCITDFKRLQRIVGGHVMSMVAGGWHPLRIGVTLSSTTLGGAGRSGETGWFSGRTRISWDASDMGIGRIPSFPQPPGLRCIRCACRAREWVFVGMAIWKRTLSDEYQKVAIVVLNPSFTLMQTLDNL
jgi:hypothetical protein